MDEVTKLLSEIQAAQVEAKSANAETISNINERLDVLSGEVSEHKTAMARSNTVNTVAENLDSEKGAEFKSAFLEFAKTGNSQKLMEMKTTATMNTLTDSEGGFIVPEDIDFAIQKLAKDISPLRSYATVRNTSSTSWSKNLQGDRASVRWTGELTSPRPTTVLPAIARKEIFTHELGAEVEATLRSLETSAESLAALIISEIGEEIAIEEAKQFVIGDGSGKPFGVATRISGTAEAMATIAEVASVGAAGLFDEDDVISLTHSIKARYRGNAKFYGSRATAAALRKLKDSSGAFLFDYANGLSGVGHIGNLMGYQYIEVEDLGVPAAAGAPLLFGDMRGYTVLDSNAPLTFMANPYKNHGHMTWFARKVVGGDLLDGQGLRALRLN